MKINYHKIMLEEIKNNEGRKPKLLLHSCCAPCSTHVIKYLSEFFELEIYFYNPNIFPKEEFIRRLEEQIRLVKEMGFTYKVIEEEHRSKEFFKAVKGLENLGEGSLRCKSCFELRLEECAKYAKENNFEYFTTTLTVSPLKNVNVLNEIGEKLGLKYNIKFLNSDFKKNNGYKNSVELSNEYKLYRQNYCGCSFSKKESEVRNALATKENIS